LLSPAGSGQLGDIHMLTLFTIMMTRQGLQLYSILDNTKRRDYEVHFYQVSKYVLHSEQVHRTSPRSLRQT
jgi:hypothetical protein